MAKDIYHNNVREALEKEGWTITRDPLRVYITQKAYVDIDIAADNVFSAEKDNVKIAVEVKSFIRKSIISAFHEAIGQYLDYRSALSKAEPDRTIYLAVPNTAYANELFKDSFFEQRLTEESANFIVFDPTKNIIVKWKNYTDIKES